MVKKKKKKKDINLFVVLPYCKHRYLLTCCVTLLQTQISINMLCYLIAMLLALRWFQRWFISSSLL